jgi:hypothetical protein
MPVTTTYPDLYAAAMHANDQHAQRLEAKKTSEATVMMRTY